MCCQKVVFDLCTRIGWVYGDSQWDFVGIVWRVDETIIQEKSGVAFFTIRIVNLFSSGNIVASFDDETLLSIIIVPYGLSWTPVIEHVCVWHEPIGFDAIDSYAENSTACHHSDFRVLKKCKLSKIWDFFANQIVIQFNVFFFLFNLFQKWTTLQIGQFWLFKKYWEVNTFLR